MVGEIRDHDTINIAIEAALTGHLVVSTIHTNSAAETITRMLNMGTQSFLLPATVNAIIAQRLVRKLCPHCRKAVPMSQLPEERKKMVTRAIKQTRKEELISRLSPEEIKNPTFYEPIGCDQCDNIGYK